MRHTHQNAPHTTSSEVVFLLHTFLHLFAILVVYMTYDPEKVTFFAETDARGQHLPFGIKAKDRSRHMYIIGKTGMGKSTLLENMAIQDIQSGEGIAFIDPHGSTAQKLLEYVPEHRVKDVLYFAPFDMEHPVSFNVMEDVGPDKRHLVVSGLMSTFKKIWVDAWSARMEYILSNTLLALLEYPGSTLLGVNRMLSDKAYREMVVENISDPSVKSFWVDEFAKYNERYMQEAGDAIKNKIGQFTANPLIRNIIGQPKSSFDVREIMDEKKILIMNLSKGMVGETNANLLGSMLITRIYLSAMSRANLNANELAKMPNFYFYVDEFQSFANETFANILSEARKYKLNLTIAHQYIEQMEEEVRDAVFGNVGTTIAFRVGPLDAEFLETVFTPQFLATDLVNLGFAQIYLSLMIDGIGSRPFSAVTMPPIPPAHISFQDYVIASSRARYAQPRTMVEAAIHTWHAPIAKKQSEVKQKQKQPEMTQKVVSASEQKNETPVRISIAPPPMTSVESSVVAEVLPVVHTAEETVEKMAGALDVAPAKATESLGGVQSERAPLARLPIVSHPVVQAGDLQTMVRSLVNDEQGEGSRSITHMEHTDGGPVASLLRTIPRKENRAVNSELKLRLTEVLERHISGKQGAKKEMEERKQEVPTRTELPTKPRYSSLLQKRVSPDTGSPPVSVRKIERMLRVTSKDKPPFH